jgi:hypothetical protein
MSRQKCGDYPQFAAILKESTHKNPHIFHSRFFGTTNSINESGIVRSLGAQAQAQFRPANCATMWHVEPSHGQNIRHGAVENSLRGDNTRGQFRRRRNSL